MSKLLTLPQAAVLLNRVTGIHDDFIADPDTTLWTVTATDSGSAAVGDAARGVLAIVPSDGTVGDNDETYVKSANEVFLFANDKPIVLEARVQFTEANTDDANVCVGLMNAVAANSILDNGGGPAASYSGAVFFKVDGSTVWQCENSVGATQKTTTTTTTAGGASYQVLRIEIRPQAAGFYDVVFFVDDVEVAKHSDQALGSPTEMNLFAGVKNGDTNLETLNVDYLSCYQLR